MQKGMNVLLWCDGLRSGGTKRKLTMDEEASKKNQVDKQEKVQMV